jgi:hypothetical protein
MSTSEWTWIPKPCQTGHIIAWVSKDTIDTVPPEGTICQCGLLVADGKGGVTEKEADNER